MFDRHGDGADIDDIRSRRLTWISCSSSSSSSSTISRRRGRSIYGCQKSPIVSTSSLQVRLNRQAIHVSYVMHYFLTVIDFCRVSLKHAQKMLKNYRITADEDNDIGLNNVPYGCCELAEASSI